jgi:hypothetical protein
LAFVLEHQAFLAERANQNIEHILGQHNPGARWAARLLKGKLDLFQIRNKQKAE